MIFWGSNVNGIARRTMVLTQARSIELEASGLTPAIVAYPVSRDFDHDVGHSYRELNQR
jgi:hypothetical protein